VEAALDTIGPNGLAISTKKVTTDDYCDTSSVLEHTHVPRRFRSSTVVGLAHYALGNRLAKAVDVIASEKVTRVACTSFHTHALFRVLGIPSFRLPIRCGGDVSAGGMTSETRRRVIRGFEKFVQAPVEWLREEMSEEVRRDIQDRRAWTEVLRNSVGRVVSEGNAPAC
jgi:hypothetical protein